MSPARCIESIRGGELRLSDRRRRGNDDGHDRRTRLAIGGSAEEGVGILIATRRELMLSGVRIGAGGIVYLVLGGCGPNGETRSFDISAVLLEPSRVRQIGRVYARKFPRKTSGPGINSTRPRYYSHARWQSPRRPTERTITGWRPEP